MLRIFPLRFGFEAIFAAIGFSGGRVELAVGAIALCVVVDFGVVVDFDRAAVDADVTLVVPDVVDLPTPLGLAVGTGWLTVVGLPVVVGLLDGLASAAGAVRHTAVVKPSSLAESRIWHLQGTARQTRCHSASLGLGRYLLASVAKYDGSESLLTLPAGNDDQLPYYSEVRVLLDSHAPLARPRNVHVEQRWRSLVLLSGVLMFIDGCAGRRPIPTSPRPPGAITFTATAYCQGTVTAVGVRVRRGIVAADPAVLPMGATIRIEHSGRYDGIYTVMDTGPRVRGHHVDLYINDCAAAKRFGRRSVRVTVVDAHD